ncbi:hypothetical protein [Amycolatopsis anabasis]|uniref:hypothetical protein n=1 Tax=Amycolatopsis anabasis TaxID=1840409 RepID=UPI00131C719C|nr:hypothetical protein [Amycolatopsis anabasis]
MDRPALLTEENTATFAQGLVQRLFLVGLNLHRAHALTDHEPASQCIDEAAAGVDWAINEIRREIHNREHRPQPQRARNAAW